MALLNAQMESLPKEGAEPLLRTNILSVQVGQGRVRMCLFHANCCLSLCRITCQWTNVRWPIHRTWANKHDWKGTPWWLSCVIRVVSFFTKGALRKKSIQCFWNSCPCWSSTASWSSGWMDCRMSHVHLLSEEGIAADLNSGLSSTWWSPCQQRCLSPGSTGFRFRSDENR